MFLQLVSVTIDVIQILIVKYLSGQIDLKDFKMHVQNKLEFLENSMDYLYQPSLRYSVQYVLNECNSLLM